MVEDHSTEFIDHYRLFTHHNIQTPTITTNKDAQLEFWDKHNLSHIKYTFPSFVFPFLHTIGNGLGSSFVTVFSLMNTLSPFSSSITCQPCGKP